MYKVNKSDKECWEWQGYLNKGGYGTQIVGSRMNGSRKQVLAHRLFYELTHGTIKDGLCVLHSCDNPRCVNPEHLFTGTRADNHKDMVKKNRRVDLKGEARPNSKLTEEQVRYIKTMLKMGIHQKTLAKTYNVHQTLISAIKRGRIWSHV